MTDWQPIETAPKGEVIWGNHTRGKERPPYKTIWHTPIRRADGYLVNNGRPWWLTPDRQWMVPTPEMWKPIEGSDE